MKFLQQNNDFMVMVRKHFELSYDALFAKIGRRAAEKSHSKTTLILHWFCAQFGLSLPDCTLPIAQRSDSNNARLLTAHTEPM